MEGGKKKTQRGRDATRQNGVEEKDLFCVSACMLFFIQPKKRFCGDESMKTKI